jgi:hypothetical protein
MNTHAAVECSFLHEPSLTILSLFLVIAWTSRLLLALPWTLSRNHLPLSLRYTQIASLTVVGVVGCGAGGIGWCWYPIPDSHTSSSVFYGTNATYVLNKYHMHTHVHVWYMHRIPTIQLRYM